MHPPAWLLYGCSIKSTARPPLIFLYNVLKYILKRWCPGAESNHRHADFQSAALPTELPGPKLPVAGRAARAGDVALEAEPGWRRGTWDIAPLKS